MHAHLQSREIRYWRDKRGHEVDFILAHTKQSSLAIECKWSASDFDAGNLQAFRPYPKGDNLVVANDCRPLFHQILRRLIGEICKFVGIDRHGNEKKTRKSLKLIFECDRAVE
jgi:hypothetical protein